MTLRPLSTGLAALLGLTRVLVGAEVLALEEVGDRGDELAAVLHVPDHGLGGVGLRLLAGLRAVDHRERRRLVVDELADRLLALRQALAVEREAVGQLFGRHADRERAQAETALADLLVAL